MKSLCIFGLFFGVMLIAISDYFIAFNTGNTSVVRIMLIVQGVVAVLPFILIFFFTFFYSIRRTVTSRVIFLWCLTCFLYLLSSMVLGWSNGNSVKYILGDTFRFLIPVLIIYCCTLHLTSLDINKSLNMYIRTLLFYFILISITKILLLLSGHFYGGGAHQFMMPPFLLFILVAAMSVNKKNEEPFFNGLSNGMLNIVFLLVGIVLTVLSLKRENWIIMILTLFFAYLATNKNKKVNYFFLSLIISALIYLSFSPDLLAIIIQRYDYTFSDNSGHGMDRSSFERIAEVKGALYSMFNHFPIGEFLFGLGSGAEFSLAPYYNSVKDSTGSSLGQYHHIHNMYMVVFFRFGVIGIILLLFPVLYLTIQYHKSNFCSKHKVVCQACLVSLIMMLVAGIPANSMYGSFFYGVIIVILMDTIYKGNRLKIENIN